MKNMKNKNVSCTTTHYRQGDVALERIQQFPANLQPVPLEEGRVVLAHGEVTGHAHTFTAQDAQKFTDKQGGEFFSVTGRHLAFRLPVLRRWRQQVMVQHPNLGCLEFAMADVEIENGQVVVDGSYGLLGHDEHTTHALTAGLYAGGGADRKVRQREYTPAGIVNTRD